MGTPFRCVPLEKVWLSPAGVVPEVAAGTGRGQTAPPRYLHWDGAGATAGHVRFYAGPCSLAALERKPFEFSQPLLMAKVTSLTNVGFSGLTPSVAILCFPRGF